MVLAQIPGTCNLLALGRERCHFAKAGEFASRQAWLTRSQNEPKLRARRSLKGRPGTADLSVNWPELINELGNQLFHCAHGIGFK